MLDLKSVTLLCVDNRNPILALRALEISRAHAHFARTVFLTSAGDIKSRLQDDIEVLPAPPIASIGDYSQFILKGLLPYVTTPHVLIIQWDGYLYNPAAWTTDFLQVDYIGARWFWQPSDRRVGNGGFSLRSRRLLEALQDKRFQITDEKPEDEIIGCVARPLLEKEYGIRFADESLADRFSFEASPRVGWPLGFHAFYNFCLVVPEDELVTLIPLLPPQAFATPQTQQLMRNCAQLQQWRAVRTLAENTLRYFPESAEARQLLSEAQRKLSPPTAPTAVSLSSTSSFPPPSSRNDPCPCGSGKRYKQCHGALADNAATTQATAVASPDALLSQAVTAHQQGNVDTAIQSYRALLSQFPDHPAQSYLAVLLAARGEYSEALKLAQRATQVAPNIAEYHNNLGLVLTDMNRFDEAVHAFKSALILKAGYAEAFSNLGLAYYEAGKPDDAIDAYNQGLAIAPEHPVLHWNRATARLAIGDFPRGWDEYEWRLKVFAQAPRYSSVRWDGSNCSKKTLLVHTEQGLGDALQFSRYLSDLAQQGARVLLHAPKPLTRLLASVAGVDSVHDIDAPAPAHDAHIPMLSLPKALGYEAPTHPPIRYLQSATLLRDEAAARIEKHAAPGTLRVGLAWAGNPVHRNDRRRSMPFSCLQPLLDKKGVRFFSLQKGQASPVDTQQLVALPEDYSFDNTAALIDQLDLIISVDTSIAHLAGALGKPVWIALPFAPDWRWQFRGDSTSWYSTARLFRQPRVGDWASVINQMLDELSAVIETKTSMSR